MTRKLFLTITATMLMMLNVSAAQPHRGVGCWRGKTIRNRTAAARLAAGGTRTLTPTPYLGAKRGLVILAEFTDKHFKGANTPTKYDHILNAKGYTSSEGFRGSVADYFRDQSNGLFQLTFDVLGPFTTKHSANYYGINDPATSYDMRAHEMIVEMCEAVDNMVNWADYDWDDDGEVDEVFVLYAGKSEADGGGSNTIWPHMWTLDEAMGETISLGNRVINVYACSNELTASGTIDGIGTFCHEFSHCLGIPDLYDTINDKSGMGYFDLMAEGLYGGDSFCPVGYTAYEKMVCGWQTPIVLDDKDVEVEDLLPMSENGQAYIIYNNAYPDEFYTIENRQTTGWDKNYPARGLLVVHVDYDEYIWENNYANAVISEEDAKYLDYDKGNDHPRVSFFKANNNNQSPKLYPYSRNDSLTATSKPAAILYNKNSLGRNLMMGSLLNIRQHSDGTMAFHYRAVNPAFVTSVNTPHSHLPSSKADIVYTLDGRRVTAPRQKGVYIVNGRKVVR